MSNHTTPPTQAQPQATAYDDAVLLGLPYYKGTPCRHGHAGLRYTTTRRCVACSKARATATPNSTARIQAWKKANPEKVAAQQRRYRERRGLQAPANTPTSTGLPLQGHPPAPSSQTDRQYVATWQGFQYVAQQQRISARKKALRIGARVLDVSTADVLRTLDTQDRRCAKCGRSAVARLDYVVPLSKGGAYTTTNLFWLCGACSVAHRHNLTLSEYADKLGL